MKKFVEVLKFKDLAIMPWKNGQGITHELEIQPINSSLKSLDFSYRISFAHIKGENEFSLFPGFNRILTIVKGDGIKFNEKKLKKNEFIQFHGEEKIVSNLLNSNCEVMDLGIIYNPQKVDIKFEKIKVVNDFQIINNKNQTTYLVLLDEKMQFNDYLLCNFDTIKILTELKMQLDNENNFIKITIQNK